MVGDGFHLRQWGSHRYAEVTAESLSGYEHDRQLNDKPTVTFPPEIILNYLADSNSIFVVANIFSDFEYLICSKFNYMQRDCTCACAVARLHPHNYISNVVVSLIIHDNKNVYLCVYV